MDIALLTVILVLAVVLFVSRAVPYEVTSLGVIFLLASTRILEPAQAFAGFASEATVTVAAMFVLSAGLSRTGSLDYLAALLGRLGPNRPRALLLTVGLVAAIPSAFLNNTPVVIMLVPVMLALCRKHGLSPSKVMIPASYFAILGGTLTLVGTSTNILVDGFYRQFGGPGFSMFELGRMGIFYLLFGAVFMILFAERLLPERVVLSQLLEPGQRRAFVTEIRFPANSGFHGRTVGQVVGTTDGIRVLELIRGEQVTLSPSRDLVVLAEDSLLVEGTPRSIHHLLQIDGVDVGSAVADTRRVKISRMDLLTAELVITPGSHLARQQLAEVGLNRLYGIKVLAIQRLGRHHRVDLREMVLREGDVLLVQGEESDLQSLQSRGGVLLVEGVEHSLTVPRRAPVAFGTMAAVVAGAALGIHSLSVLAVGGAAIMIATGCLTLRQAIRSLESSILLLLAGTIPLGTAMAETGLADRVASLVLETAQAGGPVAVVSALYLLAALFSAFLSNNATAVLLAPVAWQLAQQAGVSPTPMMVAVAFGASASFATPIGYQTNLLVMGPGGYRFTDYLRIGLPLTIITWVTATFLIPVFWPL